MVPGSGMDPGCSPLGFLRYFDSMRLDTAEPLLGYSYKQYAPTDSLSRTEARGGLAVQMLRGLRNLKSPRWIVWIFLVWAVMICTVLFRCRSDSISGSGDDPQGISVNTTSNVSLTPASTASNGTKVTNPATIYPPPQPEFEYVAMCVAVRDQARDLPEFLIHHYHHFGIRRFCT